MRFRAILFLCVLLSAAAAYGDTVVLKNGRRIRGENVVEDGEKVRVTTTAGEISFPRALVDHIERETPPLMSPSPSTPPVVDTPQANLAVGYEDTAKAVIRDGDLDLAYLARVDSEANSGTPNALRRDAAAHYAAAQFLLSHNDAEGAVRQYRTALVYSRDNVPLLLNLAVLFLRQSQFTAALEPLDRAHQLDPDSADVAKLRGWAYYGEDRLDLAVAEWKRALLVRPDVDLKHALEKAQRDLEEESRFREGETEHFDLKYSGAAAPGLARGILRQLELDYRSLSNELSYSPPEPIAVVLYTEQDFSDITRAPHWAGAINDGRIRIPVQGLRDVTPELARVLIHELTHSFVAQKTGNRCPVWIQEGIAQWMEGRRSSEVAAALVEAAHTGGLPRFEALEDSWQSLPDSAVERAYAWSLAAIESIIATGGMENIERLLGMIGTAGTPEAALRNALNLDYEDLRQQSIIYLRRAYLQ
ncbi:MAG: peptidase MA family metallohydrolase [Candidatus Acidiferrales bacterium]